MYSKIYIYILIKIFYFLEEVDPLPNFLKDTMAKVISIFLCYCILVFIYFSVLLYFSFYLFYVRFLSYILYNMVM
jgi:hypothetical protein